MFIYVITNTVNGKQYIGQTVRTVDVRWDKHKYDTSYGSKLAIHCAIREYGITNFIITVLDRAENLFELNALEIQYIKTYNTVSPNGYNLTYGGDGCEASPETLAKMSKSHSGVKLTSEHKDKIRKALLGGNFLSETIDKMRQAQLGKKNSSEAREKIRLARLGTKLSEEHKVKLSGLNSGTNNNAFRHDVSDDEITKLRLSGTSNPEIARILNAPYQLIYRRCKRLGLR